MRARAGAGRSESRPYWPGASCASAGGCRARQRRHGSPVRRRRRRHRRRHDRARWAPEGGFDANNRAQRHRSRHRGRPPSGRRVKNSPGRSADTWLARPAATTPLAPPGTPTLRPRCPPIRRRGARTTRRGFQPRAHPGRAGRASSPRRCRRLWARRRGLLRLALEARILDRREGVDDLFRGGGAGSDVGAPPRLASFARRF